MFNKVLVLSASAGAGHIRAAQAIEKAILDLNAAREVRHIDTLQYTNRIFRHFYSKAYIDMVNEAPEVLGWLYDYLDKPWEKERRRLAFDKLNTRPFVKLLNEEQPDIAICTHFLPSEIISWLTAKERLHCPQAVVVTDFDVHAMWLCHHYQQFFVALDETRVHLEKMGIPGEKITVSGIPIDPIFSQTKDKSALRAKHGLEPNVTTILISAGGFGVGNMEHLLTSLFELRHPAQIIAVCGKSAELKQRVEEVAAKRPASSQVQLKVLGFTTEMDELMSASDILLGKPGGLTTSEALAKGLVFVIVNPIPGQEERNSDHLLEEGVAIRCNNLPALAYKLDRLLDNPQRFADMQQAALGMAHPDAARTIVTRLLELNQKK
ncbi:MAG: glycosyltransferase [Acidobacteria bacterium]|nr:glycosyltransferase [Acidobacteriota bacterium]